MRVRDTPPIHPNTIYDHIYVRSHINMKNHTSFIKLPVEAAQLASEANVAPGNTTILYMGVANAVARHETRITLVMYGLPEKETSLPTSSNH